MNKYKLEIKWGIIFSLSMIIWFVIERALGLHTNKIHLHPTITMLFFIPAVTIFVFALLDKRKTDLGNYMTYKQGFITGLIITIVVTLLTPLNQIIFSKLISPDFFENMINFTVKNKLSSPEAAKDYFNFKNYLIMSIIASPIMGIVTSLIVAIFTRKNQNIGH